MKKLIMYLLFTLSSSLIAFSQGSWSPRASLPDSNRCGAIGFSIGNYGYVGLGTDIWAYPFHYFKDFWQFDPSTNSWNRKADFPGRARVCPVTFVIGNYAYVVTGGETIYAHDFLNECWQYNALTDTWTQKNNFPGLSRCYAVGFGIGANGYLGTGYDTLGTPNPVLRDFWEYDTATDTWTQKNNFAGIPRYAASAFSIGGKGYVCFGLDSAHFFYRVAKDMWAYDTGSDSWTQKSSNPTDTLGFTSGFVIGNSIYIGTGQSPEFYNVFWEYNTSSDIWTQQASFPGGTRSLCSAFAVDDTGYLGFGVDSVHAMFNSMYRFIPDSISTSINVLKNENQQVFIYPNPSNGIFTIHRIGAQNPDSYRDVPGNIEIYNVLGEKVNVATLNQVQHDYGIDISSQPNGIYLYRVIKEDGGLIGEGKLVIQK